MVGIYKIESPSGKVYIGQSIDIERRFKKYKRQVTKVQPKLYNSFMKHGSDNHIFTVLEECKPEELTQKEDYWIKRYNSTEEGLNVKQAGSKGKISESSKQKISKALSGRKITWGNKISLGNLGRKRSSETKKNLSNLKNEYWKEKYRDVYEKSDVIKKEFKSGVSKRQLMNKYRVGRDTLNNILYL